MATTTLDNLIMESGRATGIGAAAEPLTRELLKLMTGGPGGLSGFLDRFRSAGLGAEVSSYLGGRNEAALPPNTVDSVIGEGNVANIAKRVGLAPAAASSALGFEIPRLVGLLTPGGKVPAALPSDIQSFVGGEQVRPEAMTNIRDSGEQVRPAAMATVREDEQVRPTAMATVRPRRNYGLLIGLLILLGVLAGLLWALMSRPRPGPVAVTAPTVTAPTVTTPTVTTPAAPAAPALGHLVLNFRTGSAAVPGSAMPELQQTATLIKRLPPGSVVEIGGHTDNVGNAASNMTLSQRRAEAVRDILIRDGVNPSALTARGYGEAGPVASNDTANGRLENRRTEVTLVRR
jgi:OmpA-OmpF porin, OOP family